MRLSDIIGAAKTAQFEFSGHRLTVRELTADEYERIDTQVPYPLDPVRRDSESDLDWARRRDAWWGRGSSDATSPRAAERGRTEHDRALLRLAAQLGLQNEAGEAWTPDRDAAWCRSLAREVGAQGNTRLGALVLAASRALRELDSEDEMGNLSALPPEAPPAPGAGAGRPRNGNSPNDTA